MEQTPLDLPPSTPQPAKPAKPRGGWLLRTLLGLLLLLLLFGYGGYTLDYRPFIERPLTIGDEGLELTLESGTTIRRLAAELATRGVIERPRYLELYARWEKLSNRIQVGEYHIAAGTTPPMLLQQLVAGRVVQHPITLIEGWSFHEMMAAIGNSEVVRHTLIEATPERVMAAIGHPGEHPEGRFFPDTYHITRGTSDVELLQRAYQRMAQRLDTAWQGRSEGLPLKSPYEALILASIIEKETGVADERPAIAGVFIRRLQKRMRLQTDPTVIYGLGERYDGNIRRRDLSSDTPYNTYTRHGLPPTPIAMPSGEAIAAALHPVEGKSLYFVARGDGSHHFSDSLEEHNQAVRKYQLGR